MSKRFKRTAALALCATMLLSVVGCTGASPSSSAGGSVSSSAPSAAVSDSASAAPAQSESIDKMKKYDPEITLTFAKSETLTEYPEGEDAQNNVMYEMWREIMGINVQNKIQAPSSAMKDKMQMAIASNDIPDFAIVDTTMITSLIKNEMVEDMTDVYNTWATDNLKEVTGQSNNALFSPVTRNGRYMALPMANTLGDSLPILWIRSDWLEKLNLEAPKTMEELFDVAMAFTTQDPDGNGLADTYGLYLDKDLGGLNYLLAAYEVYINKTGKDEFWVKQADGSYMPGCTDPKAKVPLAKLAELYKAGGIDKEFAVKDAAKAEESIAAGKTGIYFGLFFNPLGVMKDSVANVGADWIALPMPPAEGVAKYTAGVPLNVYGYMYAKKGIANPEALVVMMNHVCDGYAAPWLSETDTEFYTRYNEIAATEKYRTAGLNNLMPFQMAGNINWGPIFNEAVANKADFVKGKDADYQKVIDTSLAPEMQWAWKKVYLEGYNVLDFENVRYSDYMGPPTDTAAKTQSLLDKEKLTTYVAIIMGQEPVDYFDQFVEKYNSIGGSQIAQEIQSEMQ